MIYVSRSDCGLPPDGQWAISEEGEMLMGGAYREMGKEEGNSAQELICPI